MEAILKGIGKVLLLIFGLLPLIASFFLYATAGNGVYATDPFSIVLVWSGFASIPILIAFYVTNVYRNTGVARNQRVLWTVILVFGNVLAFPFYWYFHIWRKAKVAENAKGS